MYLYNSLSHKKEEFIPNHPDIVKMYTCGPTVYHFAHILFAVGAWKAGELGIEGNVAGVIGWMKEMKGKVKPCLSGDVVVVGAGNTAMDAARVAKRMGARSTIVYRRTKKYMPADEHELQLAIDEGVNFVELAAPVKQADGKLLLNVMKLGEPDASGRRSPVATGETMEIPCDLVISAIGEKVDSELLKANGIEVDAKGRPAFETNVAGVYAAGDATRGPATVVEGIADAAKFAEIVIGEAHTYEIPEAAYVTKAEAIAKKAVLKCSKCACCEASRCVDCNTVCENCADSCPNRANVVIKLADGRHEIVHIDKMCNECGNCTHYCPYASEPCHDKFTLFQTAEDFVDSKNAGVLFLDGDMVRIRLDGEKDVDLSKDNDLPADIETLILTVDIVALQLVGPRPFHNSPHMGVVQRNVPHPIVCVVIVSAISNCPADFHGAQIMQQEAAIIIAGNKYLILRGG